jgi:hypothetical protein
MNHCSLSSHQTTSQSVEQTEFQFALSKTIFVVHNTPNLYLDFEMFKRIAHESVYQLIFKYYSEQFLKCVQQHGTVNVHLNMHSFTLSSVDKCKAMFDMLSYINANVGIQFSKLVNKVYVYNTPHVFETVMPMIQKRMDADLKPKVQFLSKKESPSKLAENLHSITHSATY